MTPKVLLFIDWFLPGTASGGPVRSITNMAHHLRNKCEFYVVTRNNDYCSEQTYDLEVGVWHKMDKNLYVKYLTQKLLRMDVYRKIYTEFNYTSIYINGIYSYRFSILPLLAFKTLNIPKIVGARGMLNAQAFSVKPIKKQSFLLLAKLLGIYNDVIFHATNIEEAKNIKDKISKESRIKIAANFPRPLDEYSSVGSAKERGKLRLVSLARISREKGTLYTIKSLRNISEGTVILDIYGSIYDQSYWQRCLSEIEKLPSSITVSYKGILDSDMVPEVLSKYHFFIMPSEGENFGHSILEALSAGLPVLISDKTPWRQLTEKKVGWDMSLSQIKDFNMAIKRALEMDQKEYAIWSENAKMYAEEIVHDPQTLNDNLKMLKLVKL